MIFCSLPVSLPPHSLTAIRPPFTQDLLLVSLEELAYTLAGLDPEIAEDDPFGALRQLLSSDNANAAGERMENPGDEPDRRRRGKGPSRGRARSGFRSPVANHGRSSDSSARGG